MNVEVVGKETSCTWGEAMATGSWLTLTAVRKKAGRGWEKHSESSSKTDLNSTDQ